MSERLAFEIAIILFGGLVVLIAGHILGKLYKLHRVLRTVLPNLRSEIEDDLNAQHGPAAALGSARVIRPTPCNVPAPVRYRLTRGPEVAPTHEVSKKPASAHATEVSGLPLTKHNDQKPEKLGNVTHTESPRRRELVP